ncbi:OLC1v1021376C1 [Oldenlandia corymbosa var. corymbosa]|uniref:OLC1v1021376C1 n=1 Tax=Oldenlandia corymbosa var. corymbosa TaxID=529605 RepID=A0AAV1BXR9_OLDCO|nr:OLC1v1021376C1 [Oldenlandia corymbosa var. corymbosa]
MDSSRVETSQKLSELAERLRRYQPLNHYSQNPEPRINDHSEILQRKDSISEGMENPNISQTSKVKSNKAAVLICLFEGSSGEIRVILTKRSSTLSSHPGEVALPGGKVEEGDANDVETALREANEEIGLDPSLVNVVTVLESFTNKRGISVVPVIGILKDRKAFVPMANSAEVEAIFDAPLEMFLKDENRRQVELEWMGEEYVLHFFDHEVEDGTFVIWALTAGILIRAASIIYQRPPAFQERRPTFWSRSGL